MNKILKYALLSSSGVVGIMLAGVVYVAATFNPNDYKADIVKAVKNSKQRNLHLDGEIKLSFYPNIGVSVNKISLSEFRSEKEFAVIESARVSLALLPLLRKQVVAKEIILSGLNANLIRHKDGTTSIDDLLQPSAHTLPEQKQATGSGTSFDIESISVEKSGFSYVDEGSGAQYTIKEMNLKSGRLASGVPSKIDLSTRIQANQPKLDVRAQLKTTLTFDLDKRKYQLQGMDFQADGLVLDISSLKIKASGDASADLTAQEFAAKKFVFKASGMKVKDKFDVALDAPSLNLTQDKYSADKLTLNANMDGTFGNIIANLTFPAVEGNAQAFKVSALSLDLEVKQPEQTFKVKLSSPLSGNIKTQQFNLSNLSVAVTASGDKLPNKSVSSEMKGSVQVDAQQKSVQANLAGGLLQSQIKAKVGVQGFTDPAIKFDVDVDQFDADLYLPKKSADATTPAAQKSIEPEQPLDLSALRTLNLDGSLRIGALKLMNVKTTQLRMDVNALHGLVNINPLSAKLYQGSMNGSLSINAQATPSITIIQNFTAVNVAPLAKDVANIEMLEGKGNIGMSLIMHGNTISAMKKAVNGNFSLNLADGAIKGIDIDQKLRLAQSLLSKGGAGSETQTANKDEKTAFKEFKATFKVANGIAHNDDLSLRSELIRVSGTGYINIGNDSIDYVAKAAIAQTADGQGGLAMPLRVSGPYTNLKYTLDYGAMLQDAVKQKMGAKIESKKEELKNQLQDKLKDLFK
jgi:AsmA protein